MTAGVTSRRKTFAIYGALVAANGLAWLCAIVAFHGHPILFGAAVLAYVFGLRHAVDADHIAAIDNVTRKLMQRGQVPVTAGLFFSLGHSTVVVLASIAIAMSSVALRTHFAAFKDIGAVIGTSVSAVFLFLIALANVVTLISVYRTFQNVRGGGHPSEGDYEFLLSQRGLLGRLLRPLMGLISQTWHMYPLGFLFGLGFDTASEIGVLGISAVQASHGVPIWSILIFPALFTAGMSLVDTTDAVLMVSAYRWAFVKPIRKLFYNLAITAVSIAVALAIGTLEALNLLAGKFDLNGRFWSWVGNLNDHFGAIGGLIVGIFMGCWLISTIIYRLNRYDEIDVRWG